MGFFDRITPDPVTLSDYAPGMSTLGGAGSGAASGAAVGSMFGPVGTVVGGIGGGILGYFGGAQANKGRRQQQSAMDQAATKLEDLRRQQYAQRMEDLKKAMAYFEPVDREYTRLYGRR